MAKILVLYYSVHGHIETMATTLQKGPAKRARGLISSGFQKLVPEQFEGYRERRVSDSSQPAMERR
jgi:flavodoxin